MVGRRSSLGHRFLFDYSSSTRHPQPRLRGGGGKEGKGKGKGEERKTEVDQESTSILCSSLCIYYCSISAHEVGRR